MKAIKLFLLFLLPALFATSACNQSGHVFKGTINGAAGLQVLLEQAFFDRSNTAIGRATCDDAGSFTIEQKEAFPEGLYRLTIGAKRMYFMLGGNEKKVEIKGSLGTIDRLELEITGSETMNTYGGLIREMFQNQGQISPDKAKEMIAKGSSPLMRAFLTMQLLGNNAEGFMTDFKDASKALEDGMPGSRYATDYKTMIASLEKQYLQQQASAIVKVGQPAPEISLPGPDGKNRNLSSLKGKVVLLDFWASWCRPCRMANPHVVEIYKKYKEKGFDVFSVSLDKETGKNDWVAAIKQDGLAWDNHVSDLQFWNSAPAATYGVRSIPQTFLIDRNGNIAAINPRTTLEQELLKVL